MTPDQRAAFDRDGYLVLPDALSQPELEQIRQAADQAEAQWRAETTRPGTRSQTLHQVQAPIEYDERLLRLLWHPSTFPLVRELLGEDVAMIDNDLFLTPPQTPKTHADWHHDVGMGGIHHPLSLLMVKVFFLLTDVEPDSGGTAVVPGSHRFPLDHAFPTVADPKDMPGAVQITGRAGTAYLFNCRIYHCATNNASERWRKVLIYNYGHSWMKVWPGYEPSERLRAYAEASGDPVVRQLLGLSPAYVADLAGAPNPA